MAVFNYLKSLNFLIALLLFIFLFDPYSLALKSGYLIIPTLLLFRGKEFFFKLDKHFLMIFAFTATYSMFTYFGENRGLQYLIAQTTFPMFFYALGKLMVSRDVSKKGIIYLMLIIGVLYSTSTVLSILFNLVQGGLAQTDRFVPSFWTGEQILATKAASYLIYNSVIPAIIVANRNRFGIVIKILLMSIYVATLIASFRLGSRTLIVISFLSLIASFVYIMYKQSFKENIKLVLGALIIIALAYLYLPFDLDNPIFSTLGHRLQEGNASESNATAGNRTVLWADGLQKLFENPLGWRYHMNHHNVWLDMAKEGTAIPLLFFLVSNVFCYSSIKKGIRLANGDIGFNVTFLLFFFSTFLLFFTEPVIEGNFFSIVIYCLVYGILNGYIAQKQKGLQTMKSINLN